MDALTLIKLSLAILVIEVYSNPLNSEMRNVSGIRKFESSDIFYWGPWSRCSKTCSGGNTSRDGFCLLDHVNSSSTWERCSTAYSKCNELHCLDQFRGNNFTECTHKCGGGSRYRNSSYTYDNYEMPCGSNKCKIKHERFNADIIFALDSSTSITENGFYAIKQFAIDVINSIPITWHTHVGVLSFATRVHQALNLQDRHYKDVILDRIWNMPYLGGKTCIADVLNASRQMANTRWDEMVPQILVLVTDGFSQIEPTRIQAEAVLAHNIGLYVIPIGIGMPHHEKMIKSIAYEKDNYHMVKTVLDLHTLTDSVASKIISLQWEHAKACSRCECYERNGDHIVTSKNCIRVTDGYLVNTRYECKVCESGPCRPH